MQENRQVSAFFLLEKMLALWRHRKPAWPPCLLSCESTFVYHSTTGRVVSCSAIIVTPAGKKRLIIALDVCAEVGWRLQRHVSREGEQFFINNSDTIESQFICQYC